MNYFAHGVRFLDRPYYVAGTALPDWLSVVDRRVRLRSRNVLPFVSDAGTLGAELAAGVMQHLEDDAWFHKTAAFAITSAELTVLFCETLPADHGHRPAFLGHILTEMLLDAVLIERRPDLLDGYYSALSKLDPRVVEDAVNQMVPRGTDRLTVLIPLFVQERFLDDYCDTNRLLVRLNQIMRRVKLSLLPEDFERVLSRSRSIVEQRAGALLPGFNIPPRL